jgi:hypothetical protein
VVLRYEHTGVYLGHSVDRHWWTTVPSNPPTFSGTNVKVSISCQQSHHCTITNVNIEQHWPNRVKMNFLHDSTQESKESWLESKGGSCSLWADNSTVLGYITNEFMHSSIFNDKFRPHRTIIKYLWCLQIATWQGNLEISKSAPGLKHQVSMPDPNWHGLCPNSLLFTSIW